MDIVVITVLQFLLSEFDIITSSAHYVVHWESQKRCTRALRKLCFNILIFWLVGKIKLTGGHETYSLCSLAGQNNLVFRISLILFDLLASIPIIRISTIIISKLLFPPQIIAAVCVLFHFSSPLSLFPFSPHFWGLLSLCHRHK